MKKISIIMAASVGLFVAAPSLVTVSYAAQSVHRHHVNRSVAPNAGERAGEYRAMDQGHAARTSAPAAAATDAPAYGDWHQAGREREY